MKKIIKFYLVEHSLLIAFVIAGILFSLLIYGGLPSSKVSYEKAVAVENFYVGTDLGNRAMLRVKLNDGGVAELSVASAAQVKVGKTICLSKTKTKMGSKIFRLASPQKCT
ncbi:hypothetical protein [Microbulbifer taiwanensis]|uniref:Uncharacterized protein n=1 Tax=Microbulbifer taiwanensis TaxID=986746 RepID=A0ABW1YMF9_9GAMM|nr:hypothetical protein [Microbulbifer taiwanensis]